ncbi:MAG TPA: hypothetical protein VNG89_21275 [Vicinamibacterales bacterium]|nr:hypothetical protein [Vicinamibacterales bacterium]
MATSAMTVRRRDALRVLAACMADWWLPRQLFAQRPPSARRRDRRVIVVTFGGGVRYEDTLARDGWVNIPHLASEIVPQGLVYPIARHEGLTGHFNSTGALVTGSRQNIDAYGSEPPVTPTIFEMFRREHALPPEEAWLIATNKSFGLMGGSRLRSFGDPYSANVVLPKQMLISTIKAAVSTNAGPGVEDRRALAERMMVALDEGYEGFGWHVYESSRVLSADVKSSLAKSLLEYFNDPASPTSGDELTFFMAKEIMNRFAPSLLVVNFWDIDIAHYGAYSLYLEAIRRTDRLVHELWQHVQASPQYRDRTTLLVVPEMGRDSDVAGNGFANHRSGDESCRRVWLVAVGAGVPKGAGTERPIRTLDVAPTVAEMLGFKMVDCEGTALAELT